MKNRFLLTNGTKLGTIFGAMLFVVACGGGSANVAQENIKDCTFPDDGRTEAPIWVCSERLDNLKLSAVGNYESTNAGLTFQKQQAMAAARVQIAQVMEVNVTNMVKSFAETTGFGDTETVDRVASNTTKQITSQTLQGSTLYRQAKNPETGTLFVLVGMGDAELDAALNDILNRSFTSEGDAQADWQRLQADKSFEELQAEVKGSYPAE